ncbi:MAG: NTP transferase domain-containing protein [Desulfovibrionaceae bacterium]|nr:NTP transferase domain-containing protein [Desulfovibrionaceae bacterium]MBF0512693.1 NTP transferase domain-containing protein [Desulfovibrionaceae bacterium]
MPAGSKRNLETDGAVREAAILAGGLGTRLSAALPGVPKVLAEVGGRPFLAGLLDQLAAAGLKRVVLLTGHMADAVEQAMGRAHNGLELLYSREETALGTAGAIRLALPHFTGQAALVLNGDSRLGIDLGDFIDWFVQAAPVSPVAAIAAVSVDDASRYGRLRLGEDGAVLGFDEKSAHGPGVVNAGVYLLSRAVIESIPAGRPVSLEREIFAALAGKGLTAYPCRADFIDIGTPEAYNRARRAGG